MQPGAQRQTRKAIKCVVHPRFKVENYPENDVAVVIVDVPFEETETFKPTKLNGWAVGPIDNESCSIGN